MLGKRLKQLRGKRTQETIAKQLGISRARYSHYENEIARPDPNMLQRLAELYGVTVDYLLGNDEKDDDNKSNTVDILEEIKKRPHVRDPETGKIHYIPEERAKIIADILEGYLREKRIWPEDDGEDCRSGSL
jgi:transcriptional regulator with XRE-family HTH domain